MTKILLVEDNEMNRDMLTRRLVRRGFLVVSAADGAQAVSLAGQELPDVVLMDINLPVVDGWEAIRTLKASARTSAIPIIALTAHALAEAHERALTEGCSAFVSKPIDLPELLAAIHGACTGSCVTSGQRSLRSQS
jgi:CheY-like chemotaxis protein